MDALPALVTDAAEVADLAAAVREAGSFAFDLEFVSEGRYVPVPALLQIAFGDPEAPRTALVDWTAVDPAPLLALIADPDIVKVAHAGRQDLGLLAARFGVVARGFHDSQIAAAFLGMGDQIGYAKLIEMTCGVSLDKGPQFTRWLDRPLSPRQLKYALADVHYLPAAWSQLAAKLTSTGRARWVAEESASLAAVASTITPPEEAWTEIKGARGLRGRALSSLVSLAAWRERTARASNLPLSWVLAEAAVVDVARAAPADVEALRAIRGVGEAARQHGEAIVAAVAAGRAVTPPAQPPDPGPPSARAERLGVMLAGLVQALAENAGIGARFVATRSDADALGRWYDERGRRDPASGEPDMPLFRGWRREVAGARLLAWLRGEAAVVIDPAAPGGLQIVARDAA